MINEKRILYLLTVATEKNITSAAKKLFISQPALSRMILDTEREVGTALFIRDRGNLHPTQAGEIYLRSCRDILSVSRSAAREISDLLNSQTGHITVGVTNMTGEFLIPDLMDAFEQQYPNIELSFTEDRMHLLQEMVKRGDIDIALTYLAEDPELEYHFILRDKVYLQVPDFYSSNHDGWQHGTENPVLSPDVLCGQPLILLKKGRGMRTIAEQFLHEFAVVPGRLIETENIHLAYQLVLRNKGFTFMPGMAVSQLALNRNAGVYCEIRDFSAHRDFYYCHRKDYYLTKAEKYLLNLVSKMQHSA